MKRERFSARVLSSYLSYVFAARTAADLIRIRSVGFVRCTDFFGLSIHQQCFVFFFGPPVNLVQRVAVRHRGERCRLGVEQHACQKLSIPLFAVFALDKRRRTAHRESTNLIGR